MYVIITGLKILAIVILVLLALALLITLCPIIYKVRIVANGMSFDEIDFAMRVRVLFFAFILDMIKKSNNDFSRQFKIFGIKKLTSNKEREYSENNDIDFKYKNDVKHKVPSKEYIKDLQKAEKKNKKLFYDEESESDEEDSFFQSLISKIRNKFYEIKDKVLRLNKKRRGLIRLYETQACKVSISKAKILFPKLMRHIFPKKSKGYIIYGLQEPDITGKSYGYWCLANSYIMTDIMVSPNFEDKMLDAEVEFKGYIVPLYVAVKSLIFYFNTNVRLTLKRANKILRR